ncbi:MAG: Hpt domain-containing protein [Lachnospiraceae bacterium]|nr:Hpt domain-containing protein [Lachnospiraceae bacterium]
MLTIDSLKEYGAAVEEGLARCMNNEAFYLKLVDKAVKDPAFESLEKALGENKLDEAFEAAHRLKGALANLSLTPVCKPVSELTELLRNKTEADYGAYLKEILQQKKLLEDLI